MANERETIVRAINESPNLTAAAHHLGAARRTLQNRMRYYDLPPGKSGRPREALPYKSDSFKLLGVVALGAGVIVALHYLSSSSVQSVVGESVDAYLLGIDEQIR